MTNTKTLSIKQLLAGLKKLENDKVDVKLILFSDGSGHVEAEKHTTKLKDVFDFHNIKELKKKL